VPTIHGIDTASIIAELDIPEGCVHRSVLIEERDWRGEEITAHLDVAGVVEIPDRLHHLLSNKIYDLGAVIRAEQEIPEIVRARSARTAARLVAVGTISRACGHTTHDEDNTWTTAEITARGWRSDQITTLLGTSTEKGNPEEWDWGWMPEHAARRCRWRVEEAEYSDPQLHTRKEQVVQVNAARAAAVAQKTAPAALVEVVIPGPASGANRSWRRLIAGINPARQGAFALQGPGLVAGMRYEIAVGDVIITCDQFDAHRKVSLLRVTETEEALETVKEWTIKAPLGARIVQFVERRLPLPPVGKARPLEDPANKFPGRCRYCWQDIAAGAGVLTLLEGRQRVVHQGGCPPLPPLPPLPPRPNDYGGYCRHCAKAVPPGRGIVQLHTINISAAASTAAFSMGVLLPLDRQEWLVEHRDSADCAAATLWLPNLSGDWCLTCDEWVYPGHGFWVDRSVQHEPGTCTRRPDAGPVWRVIRTGASYQPGDTFRASVERRAGDADPTGVEAPGFVCIPDGSASLIVTVLDARSGGGLSGDQELALVRASTWEEAEPVISAELDTVAALPATGTFMGSWTAEKIGPSALTFTHWTMGSGTPWVAEITGFRSRGSGFHRRFLTAKRDYTNANSRGTRGIEFFWELESGPVYEAHWPKNWSKSDRAYLIVDADGVVQYLEREQVEAWLVHRGSTGRG
jgi:hypothetical protein